MVFPMYTGIFVTSHANSLKLSDSSSPFPKRQILDSSKLKEFADGNFELDEKKKALQRGRKHCGKRRNCSF